MIYLDKRSFAKGELSPQAAARTDIAAYDTGAARIENFIVLVTGGLTRRPGTRFVAEAKDPDQDAILVPFVFSTLQAYIIEIGDGYARIYMNHGQVELDGAPYEIAMPWAAGELRRLTWVQEADVLYFFHPDFAPRKLSRFGHTNWVLSTIQPTDGPFLDENVDTGITVQASAVSGTDITLTASADLWEPSNAGGLFRLGETDPNGVQPWEAGKSYSLSPPEQARFDGNIYEVSAKNGDAGTVPPVHLEGKAWDSRAAQGIQWEYLHSGSGIVRIKSVTDARTATADVLSRLPDSVVTAPTWRWAEGAWSDRRGYPGVATFADQRLVTGASKAQPMTFWGSVAAGNYERFEAGPEADKAFRYTLASREVNEIRWLINAPILLLGSGGVVWLATGSDFEAPITPEGVRARPATEEGGAHITPEVVGGAVLYLSRNSRRVLELTYSGLQSGYAARDLTILADHIAKGA